MKIDKNLAVLTRGDSSFGHEFLRRLAMKGITPTILCVEYTPFTKRVKMAKFLAKKIGWLDAARYNAKFWLPILQRKISFGYWKSLPNFDDLAEKVIICSDINNLNIVETLKKSSINKIVLAQSGIIRQSILNLNKITLNCHPGKLPNLRGVDVIRWALLERQPIEVTLHLVDSGIDTGAILKKMPITILPNDTIESVIDKVISLSIDILVEATIVDVSYYGEPTTQDKDRGKQYYLMPLKLVHKLEKEWESVIKFYTQEHSRDERTNYI